MSERDFPDHRHCSAVALSRLLEQAPQLAKAMADGLGTTIGKLKELGEAGSLAAGTILAELEAELGKTKAATLELGKAAAAAGAAFEEIKVAFAGVRAKAEREEHAAAMADIRERGRSLMRERAAAVAGHVVPGVGFFDLPGSAQSEIVSAVRESNERRLIVTEAAYEYETERHRHALAELGITLKDLYELP